MFQSAHLKLTGMYLLIIMFVSALFSLVIFSLISRQVDRLVHMQNNRIRSFQFGPDRIIFQEPPAPPLLTEEDLQSQKNQLALSLLFVNLGILAVSGGAGYFLAGRTLRPIKLMVDDQNQFISDTSHELRTPLATLRAEIEGQLLEKKISDSRARRLLASNLEEVDRLQHMSDDLLDLARLHTSNNKTMEQFSLREVVTAAGDRVAPLARRKKINLRVEAPEFIVKGRKDQLTEVFVILLDNAIKYSPSGSRVAVSSRKTDGIIKIIVEDHGVGISPVDLPHVFERFYRADKSRSKVPGFGLGLSIAQKIVKDHHGFITVSSLPGRGSEFSVTLPAA